MDSEMNWDILKFSNFSLLGCCSKVKAKVGANFKVSTCLRFFQNLLSMKGKIGISRTDCSNHDIGPNIF